VCLAVLMAGGLALGLRQQRYVSLSGILLTLAGVLVWVVWGTGTPDTLALTVALSLALSALAWTLVDLLSGRVPPFHGRGLSLSFQHVAVRLALWAIGAVIASGVTAVFAGESFRAGGALVWSALLLTVTALTAALWEREERFAPVGLFGAGLMAAALFLQELPLGATSFARAGCLTLAGYLVLTTVTAWAVPRLSDLLRTLRLPAPLHEEPPRGWFRHTVAALASVALGASVWVCLSFGTAGGRAAGPATVALLLSVCYFLSDRAPGQWVAGLRYAALALGVVACVEASWVPLAPGASGSGSVTSLLTNFTPTTGLPGRLASTVIRPPSFSTAFTAAASSARPATARTSSPSSIPPPIAPRCRRSGEPSRTGAARLAAPTALSRHDVLPTEQLAPFRNRSLNPSRLPGLAHHPHAQREWPQPAGNSSCISNSHLSPTSPVRLAFVCRPR